MNDLLAYQESLLQAQAEENQALTAKVTGCLRTEESVKVYMQIMIFVSTAWKHGVDYLEAVRTALTGNVLTLVNQWEK